MLHAVHHTDRSDRASATNARDRDRRSGRCERVRARRVGIARAGRHPGRGHPRRARRGRRPAAFGPSELARRLGLPKSSIANICEALADVGLVRRIGTGLRARPQAGGARRGVPRRRRHRPGVLRGLPPAADRLRGDRPAGRPRRHRDDLPRPPRRPPAGPPHLADRSAPAGHGRPRPARPPSPRSTSRARAAAGGRSASCPASRPTRTCSLDALLADLAEVRRARLRDRRRGDRRGGRLLRHVDPGPATRRGPVRGQHHAAQGAGDRRAGPAPDRRPAPARRAALRSASAGPPAADQRRRRRAQSR